MASRRRSTPSTPSGFSSEPVVEPQEIEAVEEILQSPAEELIEETPPATVAPVIPAAPVAPAAPPTPLFVARAMPEPPVRKQHPRNIPRFSRTQN